MIFQTFKIQLSKLSFQILMVMIHTGFLWKLFNQKCLFFFKWIFTKSATWERFNLMQMSFDMRQRQPITPVLTPLINSKLLAAELFASKLPMEKADRHGKRLPHSLWLKMMHGNTSLEKWTTSLCTTVTTMGEDNCPARAEYVNCLLNTKHTRKLQACERQEWAGYFEPFVAM